MPSFSPDWDAVREEVVAHLQALLRIDTVNPPGNEIVAARYLHQMCARAGIEAELVEPAPGKAAVRGGLRGTGSGGGPLLLMAHMDVVPVEPAQWTVPPFAGERRDGFIYGRGAIDDKGMLAANLTVLHLLARLVASGVTLTREVALLATSDEETGGPYGIEWVAEHRPDLIEAEDAINEGGRIRIVEGRPLYAAVQCAEKVSHVVTITARGPAGHAAVPLADNAIWRLGRALAALETHREPLTLIPTSRELFTGLAQVWPVPSEATAMADLVSDDPARVRRGESTLSSLPLFDALLRTGISATMLSGGSRANVIPGEARATLNVRTLPGQRIDEVIGSLRRAIDDAGVEVTLASEGDDAPCTPHDGPTFRSIAEGIRAVDPSLLVVPYLSTGATDSARLRRLGIRAFGILPFPLEPADEARMHGHDERVPVESLLFGVRLLWECVTRIAVSAPR